MPIWLKKLLRRPYTFEELSAYASGLLSEPPGPPEVITAFHRIQANDGEDLISVWRRHFTGVLRDIAVEPTASAQRERIVRAVLTENGRRTVYLVANPPQREAAWMHTIFEESKDPADLAFQRYALSFMTAPGLHVLGRDLFGFSEAIFLSLELHERFDEEIQTLDASIRDILQSRAAAGDADVALQFGGVRDAFLQPQFAILAEIGDQIATDAVDIAAIRQHLRQLDAERDRIMAQFSSGLPH